MRRKRFLSVVCGVLSYIICFSGAVMPVCAEEIAGYHERVVTEEEAMDTWYSVGRGVYLAFGTAKVMRDGRAKVNISGSTNAHRICEELSLALYLDESTDNQSYGTIGVYHYSDKNDESVSGYETGLRVTSGYYYRARGVHSVYQGGTRETTDTCTDAITAS
ncbi:MAG: hypothetical protein HFI31_14190 [Lachnospiraceae bacterium]|nr:hypothetical protein [Lachnospiraceae bacterium]